MIEESPEDFAQDVCSKLQKVIEKFEENEIQFGYLSLLSKENLQKWGITNKFHQDKILQILKTINEKVKNIIFFFFFLCV